METGTEEEAAEIGEECYCVDMECIVFVVRGSERR